MKPPREKAKELIEKFGSKSLALMVIDEILNAYTIKLSQTPNKFVYIDDYWNEVRKEIINL